MINRYLLSGIVLLFFATIKGEAIIIGCPMPLALNPNWQAAGPRGWQVNGFYTWAGIGYVQSAQLPRSTEFKDQPTIENGQVVCRYLVQTSEGVVHYKLMSLLKNCKKENEKLFDCTI